MENINTDQKVKTPENKWAAPQWLDRYAPSLMTAALVSSDLLGFLVAGVIAVVLRLLLLGPFLPDIILWIVLVSILTIILFSMRRLYPAIGLGAVEEFRSLTISISLMFIVVSTLSMALKQSEFISRFIFGLFWLSSIVTIPAFRFMVRNGMTRLGLWGEPVVIIGPLEAAGKLYETLCQNPKIGLRPVAILALDVVEQHDLLKIPVYPIDRMEMFHEENRLRMAAVLYDDLDQMEAICSRYRDTFERLAFFDSQRNHFYLNKMRVQQYGGLIGLEVHHSLLDPWAQAFKRFIDIVVSGLAFVLLLPFFLLLAGLICLDSPGPVFYRQNRLGKHGKSFTMFKFRSMYRNADEVLSSYLAENPTLKQEWDRYQKLKEDPRITRMGRFLRRFSIDELAQLGNVLIGEMSLVGPRPILLDQQEVYGENYHHYVRVAPGISGLWQISGRNQTTFARRAELDMEYVMSWSVWLDIYIIVRTIWVVLKSEGAC
jgi:Undecaprenyl-phosphate galactose phosphotransferase WbaP